MEKEETVESKSRQQLNKLPDESLRHWKRQNKQNSRVIVNKSEEFLPTRRDMMTVKPLFARNAAQLVDYDGFHPQYLTKEEKLERRIADVKSDLFESPFKGLFSRMPAYTDFLLPNAEELGRTPRHSIRCW